MWMILSEITVKTVIQEPDVNDIKETTVKTVVQEPYVDDIKEITVKNCCSGTLCG